jgi:threonine aldolase
MPAIIDLRSDTVTRPTAQMRAAMAAAEVGDDVYGEDPTVNLLERRAAEIFGREAALFVPTGTMGNQIAIRLHTQPGQEVIAESRAHILDWEMATTAVFSGCLVRAVPAERGILTWKHIEPAIYARGAFRAATGLIEIENTANLAGGTVHALPVLEEIWAGCKGAQAPGASGRGAHLQRGHGAGRRCESADQRLRHGDVLFVEGTGRAGRLDAGWLGGADGAGAHLRKALGGGMRQAGVLAAAGLIALEQGPAAAARGPRQRAPAGRGALASIERVSRSIWMRSRPTSCLPAEGSERADVVARLKARGILASAFGPDAIRLVTHLDVDRAACVKHQRWVAHKWRKNHGQWEMQEGHWR